MPRWGVFAGQLDYKCTWYGAEADERAQLLFPSTQLCSQCGVKTKLRLRDRTYRCRNRYFTIDRDLNAAINLARFQRYHQQRWSNGDRYRE